MLYHNTPYTQMVGILFLNLTIIALYPLSTPPRETDWRSFRDGTSHKNIRFLWLGYHSAQLRLLKFLFSIFCFSSQNKNINKQFRIRGLDIICYDTILIQKLKSNGFCPNNIIHDTDYYHLNIEAKTKGIQSM